MKINSALTFTLAVATAATVYGADEEQAGSWLDKAIAPVTNPIYFETPMIQSEVRPVFMSHRLDKDFLGADATARLYAVQLRWAVTDQLAIIAVKDGYIEINPDGAPATDGWADLAAGVKYTMFRDDEEQMIITPGFTIEIPTGTKAVFQGNGSGGANVFVSAMKGWGNMHLTGNLGGYIPFAGDQQTANLHYSAMLDYYTCKWFIPFVSANAFTTLSESNRLPFNSEGFDLINFGSMNARGRTQVAAGVGFRSRLLKSLDIGVAYEYGFTPDDDIFKDRVTADIIWRF